MLVGADLAAWLTDADRQEQSRLAAKDFTRRWAADPAVRELKRELAALESPAAADVLAVAHRFLAQGDIFSALIRDFIAVAAENPFFRPHFLMLSSDVATGVLLYGDSSTTVSLGVTNVDDLAAKKGGPRGPSSIAFTGLATAYHFIRGGDATLSFWEAPEIGQLHEAGDMKCRPTGRRRIADGETFEIDGRRQSFVIEHATSDLVYLQAEVQLDRAPMTAEYDSRTLELVGSASTDEASSRVQMMVSLLRLMDRRDAAPHIARMIGRSPFYARWYLMRELLALDAGAAKPVLDAMASADPHPEVRAAALQTLEMFFGDEEPARCRA